MLRKKLLFSFMLLVSCFIVLTILGNLKVDAAAGTIYESEPNDDFDYADITYDDYDNYGYIPSTDTEGDMWVVTFPYSGYANFWLESIPTSCNYDMAVYDLVDMVVLGSSLNTGNRQELLTLPVVAGREYYIFIFSASGYSSSDSYKMRTKIYPSADIDIPLYGQELSYTCSAASIRMLLEKYGWFLSEEGVVSTMQMLVNNSNTDWNIAGNVAATINYYLNLSRRNIQYSAVYIGSETQAGYTNRLISNICNGYSVIPLITVSQNKIDNGQLQFLRATSGHYIVVRGIYYDFNNGIFRTKINDPFYQSAVIYDSMPASMVWTANLDHPHDFIICVN